MATDGTCCKVPQFSGLKGKSGSLPSGPHDGDTSGSGKAGNLGNTKSVGMRSHKTRQATKKKG